MRTLILTALLFGTLVFGSSALILCIRIALATADGRSGSTDGYVSLAFLAATALCAALTITTSRKADS